MEQFYPTKTIKIAIAGFGPSGAYCAINLLKGLKENNINNFELTIFDKAQILRTLLPTGNGRCNITNSTYDMDEFISNYPRGQKFLYSIFSKHFNYDSIEFFKSIGVETYSQSDLRVFPKSNSASDVRNKMLNALKTYNNYKIINKTISDATDLAQFDYKIIALGSKGTDNVITSFNHKLIPFTNVLCGLVIDNFNYPKGVSVNSLDGDFIFTDWGISGPLAFKLSSINLGKPNPYEITVNLFKYDDLISAIKLNSKKSIGNVVSQFIPRSLAHVLVKDFDKKASEISKHELMELTKLKLTVIKNHNKGEIVRAGGVDLDELDNNCKSKINKNLWFCGEILNIDGFCGGFNLQNCWSTGFVVANDVISSIIKDNN